MKNKPKLSAPAESGGAEEVSPDRQGSRAERERTRDGEGRKKRIPLGTPRAKLSAEPIPGYVLRWVNDKATRLQDAQNAGYQFVETRGGGKVNRPAGASETGAGMNCYLMKIKEEFYNEDQAVKQGYIDEIESAIERGVTKGAAGQDMSNQYVPKEGISIRRK